MSSSRGETQPPDPHVSKAVADVVAAVHAGAKYRHIAPALVEALAARELAAGARPKDAVKAVKNKLHQVFAAYHTAPFDYARWLKQLSESANDPASLRATCRAILASHASTRERLPILDGFYTTLFADGAGRTFVPHDALSRIAATANAPVYVFIDQYLGRGTVGGHLYTVDDRGPLRSVGFEHLFKERWWACEEYGIGALGSQTREQRSGIVARATKRRGKLIPLPTRLSSGAPAH